MKLRIYLLATLFLLPAVQRMQAQVERNVIYQIGLGLFNYTPKEENENTGKVFKNIAVSFMKGSNTRQMPDYADDVRANITKGFGNVIRLQVIDGRAFQEERLRDENLLFADGNINSISITSKGPSLKERKMQKAHKTTTPASETGFEANISVTINLKNAFTRTMEDSRIFNASGTDSESESKAMAAALVNLSNRISNYYNGLLPISASIVERGEVKKEKQKTVYIDLGTAMGAYESQEFDIYSIKTIAGKEARIEIGRLKIDEVLGEELSLCKVTKGSKEVKAALDAGQTLVVTVR